MFHAFNTYSSSANELSGSEASFSTSQPDNTASSSSYSVPPPNRPPPTVSSSLATSIPESKPNVLSTSTPTTTSEEPLSRKPLPVPVKRASMAIAPGTISTGAHATTTTNVSVSSHDSTSHPNSSSASHVTQIAQSQESAPQSSDTISQAPLEQPRRLSNATEPLKTMASPRRASNADETAPHESSIDTSSQHSSDSSEPSPLVTPRDSSEAPDEAPTHAPTVTPPERPSGGFPGSRSSFSSRGPALINPLKGISPQLLKDKLANRKSVMVEPKESQGSSGNHVSAQLVQSCISYLNQKGTYSCCI